MKRLALIGLLLCVMGISAYAAAVYADKAQLEAELTRKIATELRRYSRDTGQQIAAVTVWFYSETDLSGETIYKLGWVKCKEAQ